MHNDLKLALELADVADRMGLARFRAEDLAVETKPDMTPVTEADRAVERALRERLAAERPDHAVVGEEFGAEAAAGPGVTRWIIDPIDGTKNYVRGVPVWGTLIGVEADGEVVAGVVSAPALGRRWWAARGEGAWGDGRRLRVSRVAGLGDASLSHASIEGWHAIGRADQFLALATKVWRTRGFGDFWQHMLVAEGAVDAALEPTVELWDVAALKIIVEEAGGRMTDLGGTVTADGGNAVTSNGLLHDQLLAALQ
jgi:histidinol-phosphatase